MLYLIAALSIQLFASFVFFVELCFGNGFSIQDFAGRNDMLGECLTGDA